MINISIGFGFIDDSPCMEVVTWYNLNAVPLNMNGCYGNIFSFLLFMDMNVFRFVVSHTHIALDDDISLV